MLALAEGSPWEMWPWGKCSGGSKETGSEALSQFCSHDKRSEMRIVMTASLDSLYHMDLSSSHRFGDQLPLGSSFRGEVRSGVAVPCLAQYLVELGLSTFSKMTSARARLVN